MGFLEELGSATKFGLTQAWNRTLSPFWVFTDKTIPGVKGKPEINPIHNVIHDTPIGKTFDALDFLYKYGIYIVAGIILIVIIYKMDRKK